MDKLLFGGDDEIERERRKTGYVETGAIRLLQEGEDGAKWRIFMPRK